MLALIAACDTAEPATSTTIEAFPIDGQLDCETDFIWTQQGSPAEGTTGEATPDEAAKLQLERFQETHGGEVQQISDVTWSLVEGGREQVTMTAVEMPAGGWMVLTVTSCEGYQPP